MLSNYRYILKPDQDCRPRPEWGYRLYAALLEQLPNQFATDAHNGEVTPVSQYLSVKTDGALVWSFSLLGEHAEEALSGTLDTLRELRLEKDGVCLTVENRHFSSVSDADALLNEALQHNGIHRLRFSTATAFKSRGQYLNLPTTRLILQSLMKKWNGCMPECPIEDEDGEGLETMAYGLRCRHFQLRNQMYYLKGNSIPGFVGELTIENRLSGFHRQLADALLLFSAYSGVGIKTTLGMGGVEVFKTN